MVSDDRLRIEDDFAVLRRAKRLLPWASGLWLTLGPLAVAFLAASIAFGKLQFLIASAACGFYGWDARVARQHVAWSATVKPSSATVAVSDDTIVINHPILLEPLVIPVHQIRVFATAPRVEPSMTPRTYELFLINRAVRSTHALYEPRSFLFRGLPDLGKEQVPLASVDLGAWVPNVALVFTSAQPVTMYAPGSADGWTPPLPINGGRSLAGWTALVHRTPRTLNARGLYLRMTTPDQLANLLESRGVRSGFTCDDWVHATGELHP